MACEDQITPTDLTNSKLDVITQAEIATSKEGGVSTGDLIFNSTDRFGNSHLTSEGALARIQANPINGGVWAVGITFNAYNDYMIYTGVAYKPKATTTLPYVSESVPNVANVEPFLLNDAGLVDLTIGGVNTNVSAYLNGMTVYSYILLAALSGEDLIDGRVVNLTSVTDFGIRGPFTLINSTSHGYTYTEGAIVRINDDWYALREISGGIVFSEWWGHSTSNPDNSVPINAAIKFCRENVSIASTVIMPSIPGNIQNPIKARAGVNLLGQGTNSGANNGTELICDFSASVIATPPTDIYTGTYSPVLDYTPMMYNLDLLSQITIGGFRLNGNNKDVYGQYFNEYFFMRTKPTFIINCNKRPYTCLVGQSNYYEQLTCNTNGAGIALVRCSTMNFDVLDTEGNKGNQLDIIAATAASTKTAITIDTWHYEETTVLSTDTFARFSGRNICIRNASINTSGVHPLRYIELLGTGTYNIDGLSIPHPVCSGADLENISFLAATGTVRFNSGCLGANINVTSVAQVVDNSGNTTNQIDGINDAQRLPRGTIVTTSTGTDMLTFPDDNTVRFYDNANRNLTKSGADWLIENTGGRVKIEGSTDVFVHAGSGIVDIDAGGGNAGRFDGSTTSGDTRMLLADHTGSVRRVIVDGSGFLKLS